ncbi:MAG: glycosyltransferase [Lachnospiraceae bacterium]
MRFLLFDGGTVETLEYFLKCIAAELKAAGKEVFTFQVEDETTRLPQLEEYVKQGDVVLITFNFHSLQHEAIFYKERQLLWNRYQVLCVNIVVDHPLYYYKELKDLPERYVQLCIDKGHEEYMRRYYPQVLLGKTMPLAGSNMWEAEAAGGKQADLHNSESGVWNRGQESRPYKSMEERTKAVSFVGNYTPPKQFEQYITRLDDEYEAFYRGMLDDFMVHPWKETHEVFEEHIRREMGELSGEEMLLANHNLMFLDLYIRFYFRGEVIRLLTESGIPVHVYGAGWELLETKRKDLLFCNGSQTSAQCLKVLADTKISLNVMPWFKQGAHDRIYSSMLSGAVSVTDTSRYLTKTLSDGTNVVFYELSELAMLPEVVHTLLGEEEKLQQIADAGYEFASERHTWKQYTRELLTLIESVIK